MPEARERSRMEAPSYPLSQKTSVAWERISPRRRSKRDSGTGSMGRRLEEGRIVRTFVLIIQKCDVGHKHTIAPRVCARELQSSLRDSSVASRFPAPRRRAIGSCPSGGYKAVSFRNVGAMMLL